MKIFERAREVIAANRRAYVTINVVFYALLALCMAITLIHPAIQETLLSRMRGELSHGMLKGVAEAYAGGHVVRAMVLTFVVNSLAGALAFITLPSLVIPFAGVAFGSYRACMWGLMFAPGSHRLALIMVPHLLTLVLEGQGYILAMFGAWLLGKWCVRPRQCGFASAGAGYRAGIRANLALYPLILAVLAVAAVYEAIEVIGVRHYLAAH